MLDLGLMVLLRDHAAAKRYRRESPVAVDCPIVVLHWQDDEDVTPAGLQGWRRYADSVEFRVLDGGHYDFMNAPDGLTTLLTRWL